MGDSGSSANEAEEFVDEDDSKSVASHGSSEELEYEGDLINSDSSSFCGDRFHECEVEEDDHSEYPIEEAIEQDVSVVEEEQTDFELDQSCWDGANIRKARAQILAFRLMSRQLRVHPRVSRAATGTSSLAHDVDEAATRSRLGELQVLAPYLFGREHVQAAIESRSLRLIYLQRLLRQRIFNSNPNCLSTPLAVAPALRIEYIGSNHLLRSEFEWILRKREADEKLRRAARQSWLLSVCEQQQRFLLDHQSQRELRFKLCREVHRYFQREAREKERQERLRLQALRTNDIDTYKKMVEGLKDERIKDLLRMTENYLKKIGARVQDENKREPIELQDIADSKDANGEGNGAKAAVSGDAYQLEHRIKEVIKEQPSTFGNGQLKLKPYQIEGLQWLVSLYNNNLNGILADEMGLGKTIQVKQNFGPFLVVVPLATLSNWAIEFARFAPHISVVVYRGNMGQRQDLYLSRIKDRKFHVLLVQYDFMLSKRDAALKRIQWEYLVIDEGHRLKNKQSKLFITLKSEYKCKYKVILSGTPLQNNLMELWSLLNFLMPTIFDTCEDFETWFNSPFERISLGEKTDVSEEMNLLIITQLHAVLRPFMLRRVKSQLDLSLSEAKEVILKCQLSALQEILYAQLQNKAITTVDENGEMKKTNFNNTLMQLRKVCNHPFIFPEYYLEDPISIIRTSGKFHLLNRILPKLKLFNHRVLVYSQMTELLDILEQLCELKGYTYRRMDGSTKAELRTQFLEEFNAEGSDIFIFLLSTRAGGQGINLQTADTVILFDSDWNPMMDEQAKARVHRIGQVRDVLIIRLVTPNTVEERIVAAADARLRMDDLAIQSGLFNLRSNQRETKQLLEYKLSREFEEKMAEMRMEAHTDKQMNKLIARAPEELLAFSALDAEEASNVENPPLTLMSVTEVPEYLIGGLVAEGSVVDVVFTDRTSLSGGDRARGVVKRDFCNGTYEVECRDGRELVVPRSSLLLAEEEVAVVLTGPRGRRQTRRPESVSVGAMSERQFLELCEKGFDPEEIHRNPEMFLPHLERPQRTKKQRKQIGDEDFKVTKKVVARKKIRPEEEEDAPLLALMESEKHKRRIRARKNEQRRLKKAEQRAAAEAAAQVAAEAAAEADERMHLGADADAAAGRHESANGHEMELSATRKRRRSAFFNEKEFDFGKRKRTLLIAPSAEVKPHKLRKRKKRKLKAARGDEGDLSAGAPAVDGDDGSGMNGESDGLASIGRNVLALAEEDL